MHRMMTWPGTVGNWWVTALVQPLGARGVCATSPATHPQRDRARGPPRSTRSTRPRASRMRTTGGRRPDPSPRGARPRGRGSSPAPVAATPRSATRRGSTTAALVGPSPTTSAVGVRRRATAVHGRPAPGAPARRAAARPARARVPESPPSRPTRCARPRRRSRRAPRARACPSRSGRRSARRVPGGPCMDASSRAGRGVRRRGRGAARRTCTASTGARLRPARGRRWGRAAHSGRRRSRRGRPTSCASSHDPPGVGHGPDRVRGEREGDDAGPVAELPLQVVQVQGDVLLVEVGEADDDAEARRPGAATGRRCRRGRVG